jgi:hypothetical protein
MSADTFRPNTNVSPRDIAIKPALQNHPVPADVAVERRPSGAISSANPSGGYVSPGALSRKQATNPRAV